MDVAELYYEQLSQAAATGSLEQVNALLDKLLEHFANLNLNVSDAVFKLQHRMRNSNFKHPLINAIQRRTGQYDSYVNITITELLLLKMPRCLEFCPVVYQVAKLNDASFLNRILANPEVEQLMKGGFSFNRQNYLIQPEFNYEVVALLIRYQAVIDSNNSYMTVSNLLAAFAINGALEVIDLLLTIKAYRHCANIGIDNIIERFICGTTQYEDRFYIYNHLHTKVLDRFIKLKIERDKTKNNYFIYDILIKASQSKQPVIVDHLIAKLTIPYNLEKIYVALHGAVKKCDLGILNQLLAIQGIEAIAANYDNELLKLARLYTTADYYNPHAHEIVTRLLQIPVIRHLAFEEEEYLQGNLAGLLIYTDLSRSSINTHTTSVHQSVSQSAINLLKAFHKLQANTRPKYLAIEELIKDNQFICKITSLVNKTKYSNSDTEQLSNKIQTDLGHGIKKINQSQFVDPISGIYLTEILNLILTGIEQISNTDAKHDAILNLCLAIYNLYNEYGDQLAACDAGFFNGLIYSQQTTLPHQVVILIHTKADASVALCKKANQFALNILSEADYSGHEGFRNAVLNQAILKNASMRLLKEVISEHYLAFDFKTEDQANSCDLERLQQLYNQHFFDGKLKNMFNLLPIDYENLFASKTQKHTLTNSLM